VVKIPVLSAYSAKVLDGPPIAPSGLLTQ